MCWVRPGVFEAKARRFCWVRTLIAVDLPALERPTKAISGSSLTGNSASLLAVVRKRAVWVHAMASFAAACSSPPEAAAGDEDGDGSVMTWPKYVIVKSADLDEDFLPHEACCSSECRLALIFRWRGPSPPSRRSAAKADPAKGSTIASATCAACHSSDGSRGSAANPILQGQHPDYLAKQLADFKSGKRNSAIMKPIAAALSEADMKNVSAFYAGKQAKPGFAKNKDLVSLGEKLYRGGVATIA